MYLQPSLPFPKGSITTTRGSFAYNINVHVQNLCVRVMVRLNAVVLRRYRPRCPQLLPHRSLLRLFQLETVLQMPVLVRVLPG
jgi:hypothetical protein